jgi:HD-GYP domain-containing protein (c-di-GMP phosphodiesterase class II)
MLKRIVLVDGDDAMKKRLQRVAKKSDLDIKLVTHNERPPVNSVAVISPNPDSRSLMDLAAAIARNHDELLKLIADAIDCREELAPGSSLRVMSHAARFGEALALPTDEQLALERGALLRDLGKLRIPNDILLKYTLQRHTHLGAEMAKGSDGFKDIEPILRWHHENWDGTGYPDGLEGKAIPTLARIVRIVDTFCGMTSRRAYRKKIFTVKEASEHLRSEADKLFDGELLKVFFKERIGKES